MANGLKIKRGDGTPVAGSDGSNAVWPYELAWDYTNNKLWINDNGTMREVSGSSGTITSVTGMTNNNVLTASGSTTISGESGLTFDGSTLAVTGQIDFTSELNFTGAGNKIIDIETLAGGNSLTIRHHNPTGNLFENALHLTANAGAKLYYNNGLRLETTDAGVDVSGHLELPYGEINDAGTDMNIVSTNALTLGTESGTALTLANASTVVAIANKMTLPASHSADKITMYAGGNEKIGTEANTLLFTGANFKFKDTSGNANLTFDGTNLDLPDSKKIRLGTSQDLEIYHDGTNSVINNTQTGALQIYNNVDNGMVELLTDNGSGGTQVFLRADGANNMVRMPVDGVKFTLGAASDLQLYHDGSNNFLRNNTTDQDFSILVNDGGTTKTALTIDSSEVGKVKLPNDNQYLSIGASGDLYMYHDGSNSIIRNATGDLYLRNDEADKDIIFQTDDGSGGVTAYYTVDGANLINKFYKHIRLPVDSQRISVGAGNDLSMTHDGTNSYIDNGTGMLFIRNTASNQDIRFTVNDGGVTSNLLTLNSASSRVGIGTTSPAAPLSVEIPNSGDTSRQEIARWTHSGQNTLSLFAYGGATDLMQFGAWNSEQNISIVTDSSGSISASSTKGIFIKTGGNVGIGNTSPGAKLDVKSQINVTNSSNASMVGLKGTNFGYSTSYKALQIGNTSGTYSIALGYDPSTNASSSFTGDGREVIFRNGVEFTTPNSANNGFHNDVMVLKDGVACFGHASPWTSTKLDLGTSGSMRTGERLYFYDSNRYIQRNGNDIDYYSNSGEHNFTGNVDTTGSFKMDNTDVMDTNKRLVNLTSAVGTDRSGGTHVVDFATPNTPGSTGWYTICKANSVNARGGGIITISATGGSITPTSLSIDFMFDWSGVMVKCITSGQSGALNKVRAIETGSTTELQIYVNTTVAQALYVSFERDRYNPNFALLDPWATASPTSTQQEFLLQGFTMGFGTTGMYATMPLGRMGLGTNSPAHPLDVSGNIRNSWYGSAIAIVESTAGGYGAYQRLTTTTNSYDLISLNGDFKIDENGVATRFVIKDTTGNVGIGPNNTSPGSLLTVRKDGTQVSNPSTSYQIMTVSNSNGGIAIQAGASSDAFVSFGDYGQYDAGRIRYHNSTHHMDFCTGGNNPRMTLQDDGHIAIANTKRLIFDGVDGNTYINQNTGSSSRLDFVVNGSGAMDLFNTKLQVNGYLETIGGIYIRHGGSDFSPGINFLGGSNTSGSNAYENATIGYYDNSGTGLMRFGINRGAGNFDFLIGGNRSFLATTTYLAVPDGHYLAAGNDNDVFIRHDGNGHFQSNAGQMYINNVATTNISMSVGNDEKVRIENDGDLHVKADVVAYSSTPSDIRLKKNFTKIDNGLDVINKLDGQTFNWKKDEGRLSAGFKAQEVEKVLPHLVDERELPLHSDDEKDYKVLRYEELIPYLVEAIKEQQVQIDELKTKLGE